MNLLTNICKIRKGATGSVLRYLFTNNSNNNYVLLLRIALRIGLIVRGFQLK